MNKILSLMVTLGFLAVFLYSCLQREDDGEYTLPLTSCYEEHAFGYNFSQNYWRKDTIRYHNFISEYEPMVRMVMRYYGEETGIFIIQDSINYDLFWSLEDLDQGGFIDEDGVLRNALAIADPPPYNDKKLEKPIQIAIDRYDVGVLEGTTVTDFFFIMRSLKIEENKVYLNQDNMTSYL